MTRHHHHHHPGLAFGAGMAVGAGMAMGTGRGGSDQVTVTNTGNTTTVTDVHRNRFGRVTEVDTIVTNNNRAGPVYVAPPRPVTTSSTVYVNQPPPYQQNKTVIVNGGPTYRAPPPQTNVAYATNNNAGPIIYTPPPQQNKTVIVNGGPVQQQVPVATQVQMQPPPPQPQPPQKQWPVAPYMTEFSQMFFSAGPEQKTDSFGRTSWSLPPMKAREVLIRETQLPTTELKKIWDLVEEDGSGDLDLEEFGLAMFLARNLKNGMGLPPTLPEYLKPPSHPASTSNPF